MNLFKDKNNRQKKIAIQNDKPIFQSKRVSVEQQLKGLIS